MEALVEQAESEPAWLQLLASTELDGEGELARGAVLCGGRYLVQEELGRGGMGVVYAAWDEERGASVALKTLTGTEPAAIYAIKREFRGLAHVAHRNLARPYELFEDGGRWCFSLELVPGDTLLRALRDAPPEQIRGALAQLAAGIGALHAAGKLHCDLKPSNVMLTPEGRVVILDFGLSEEIRARPRARCHAHTSGTPGYLAPELSMGAAATPASDWYAFGVILRELFGGAQLPDDLGSLCQALLSEEPDARPTAAEVLRCLASPEVAFDVLLAPPFLGRVAELERMQEAYAASLDGERPVVLLVSGEPGVGKTALVQELVAGLSDALVLIGRCHERERVPFKAFDAAIDELSRYLGEQGPLERGALLPPDVAVGSPPGELAALCRLFPVLGEGALTGSAPLGSALVGSALVGSALLGDDLQELRRRGFAALCTLLARIQARQPVVLWLDDLQWTDEDSTLLLLCLLRQSNAPRLLLIVSHRREGSAHPPCLEPLYRALGRGVRSDVRRLELGPREPEHPGQRQTSLRRKSQ